MLVFVSGGVRSGKSAAAERLVEQLRGAHSRCVYIATGRITDEEMKERVKLHQAEREQSEVEWLTIESGRNLAETVVHLKEEDVVLLDCATNWMANELFAFYDGWEDADFQREAVEGMKEAVMAIREKVKHFVIVSNDLFEGGVLEGATFTYMKLLGVFHQWLVEAADAAIAAEAGTAIVKKQALEIGWIRE